MNSKYWFHPSCPGFVCKRQSGRGGIVTIAVCVLTVPWTGAVHLQANAVWTKGRVCTPHAASGDAGVNPAASVHWLRHAHASHAIDNGAPITLVSATLGHADLKTTSVYAHARPGESSGRYLK